MVGPGQTQQACAIDVGDLRQAIRTERKLELAYRDQGGQASRRVVWPLALGYFEQAQVLVAWCELRAGFRHFRTDRIDGLAVLEARYPERRSSLVRAWREQQGAPAPIL